MAAPLDEKIIQIIVWILYFIGLYFSIFWLSVFFFKPKPEKKPKKIRWDGVTFLVPIYNEEDSIKETLESIYNIKYPKDKLKVICINDGSTDNSLKILKELKKKYNFMLISQKNKGKYAAMNRGLKHVKTPFFAVFDADSIAEQNSLKIMMSEFDKPEVAVVMPIMKVYKPKSVLEYVQWLEYLINIFFKYAMGKLDCIHVVPGPFSIYRTDVVKKLGGFRKAHLTEDLELALRLQKHNYKLKQSLDAVVYTKCPQNIKALISQRLRWYHGTMLNIKDYKEFLFNKKYGDFGIFHLPMVTITGFISVLGVSIILYLFLKGMYHTFKRWYLTHFDFWTYLTSWRWNTGILDINYEQLFFTGMIFAMLGLSIYMALVTAKEKAHIFHNIKHFFMFIYYFFIYQILMGYIWLKVAYRLALRKTNKWVKFS